jgi:hypothetical protein
MSRRVRLTVDRLVLSGVVPANPAAFERDLKTAIARELGRAAKEQGFRTLRSGPHLDGGAIANPADPSSLGRHIAGRLTRGRS